MTFTLQLDVVPEKPTSINRKHSEHVDTTKLLGDEMDSHFIFAEHVISSINKTKPPVHGILTHSQETRCLTRNDSQVLHILSWGNPRLSCSIVVPALC